MQTKTVVGVDELIDYGADLLNKSYDEVESILEEDCIIPEGIEIRECDYGDMEYEFDSKNWSEDTKKIMFTFREKHNLKKFTLSLDE